MSAVASSSDLSKQPESNPTFGLLYGYEHVRNNELVTNFVEFAVRSQLKFFHDKSPVLENIPFKSCLIDTPHSFEKAVEMCLELLISQGYELNEEAVEKLKVCLRFPYDYGATAWLVSNLA